MCSKKAPKLSTPGPFYFVADREHLQWKNMIKISQVVEGFLVVCLDFFP